MTSLRYYQIRYNVSRGFNMDNFNCPIAPLPDRITCRAICTPDCGTRICSPEMMLLVEPLDYDAEWDSEPDNIDELRDWWSNMLCDVDRDVEYHSYRSIVTAYEIDGPVEFSCPASFQDAYEVDEETIPSAPEEALESAFGNHLV